jgi:hypothetical protein
LATRRGESRRRPTAHNDGQDMTRGADPIDDRTHGPGLTGVGLPPRVAWATFRGAGGLGPATPAEQVASPEGFAADPELARRFFSMRRREAGGAERTRSIAPWRPGGPAQRPVLAPRTSWVGMARRAHPPGGDPRDAWGTRCSRCMRPPFEDVATRWGNCLALPPAAPSPRPDIGWPGEMLVPATTHRVDLFMREAVGGAPSSSLPSGRPGRSILPRRTGPRARSHGAQTWLANSRPADNAGAGDHVGWGRPA